MKSYDAEMMVGNRMKAGKLTVGKDKSGHSYRWRFEYEDDKERGAFVRLTFTTFDHAYADALKLGVEINKTKRKETP